MSKRSGALGQSETTAQPGAAGAQSRPSARLVVSLPIPPRTLSPNGRVHWRVRSKAIVVHRTWGQVCAMDALNALGCDRPLFPEGQIVTVSAIVYRPTRGKVQDDDNFKASCKSYLDGFTFAAVWADDAQARWGAVEWKTAAESPWEGKAGMEMILTEAA